jgi:hypothetical protein
VTAVSAIKFTGSLKPGDQCRLELHLLSQGHLSQDKLTQDNAAKKARIRLQCYRAEALICKGSVSIEAIAATEPGLEPRLESQ